MAQKRPKVRRSTPWLPENESGSDGRVPVGGCIATVAWLAGTCRQVQDCDEASRPYGCANPAGARVGEGV
jgi:hypothetical protein